MILAPLAQRLLPEYGNFFFKSKPLSILPVLKKLTNSASGITTVTYTAKPTS